MSSTTDVSSGLQRLAPLRAWLSNGGAGYALALIPLSLFLWFATMLGPVLSGERLVATWAWVPSLGVSLSFAVDGLSLLFALIVSGVGLLIVLYANGYMAGDPQINRFYTYLFVFMGAMLGMVLADNIITLFVFWELTSISSFLLIGYKHNYASSRTAALQALLITGMGGLALLGGVILLGLAGGSWELSVLLERGPEVQASPLYGGALALILLGAFTKSAQVPFQFWLPGAMAAPTPVSAYLHSATMVKAGVYLLARLSPIMGGTASWQFFVLSAGALTMLLGAVLAVLQTDLKRILAFTTVSGLGTLVMMLGVGTTYAVEAAMVFLVVHSLYKGCLFMVAGAIDHETGTRDITVLSGLRTSMPYTFAAALLAGLSMSGIPFLFGFVGKELIYEAALDAPTAWFFVTLVAVTSKTLMMVAAGMVALKPFLGPPGTDIPRKPHEAPLSMLAGPLVLAFLSLLFGVLPGVLPQPIIGQAVSAVLGEPHAVELKIFPDYITTYFVLSMLTIAVGGMLYPLLYHWRGGGGVPQWLSAPLRRWLEQAPERGYTRTLEGMQALARWQTRTLQTGYLRSYILIILSTMLLLTTVALVRDANMSGVGWVLLNLFNASLIEWLLAGVVVAATFFTVRAKTRLAAVVGVGVVGYGVALIFALNSAPDLAVTQFAVETLSVIVFVLVLYRLPNFTTISSNLVRLRDAVTAGLVGLVVTVFLLTVLSHPMVSRLSPFFAEASYTEAKGRNVVNVILVDFRSLDTLGEIAVVGIAAVGIYALMHLMPQRADASESSTEE